MAMLRLRQSLKNWLNAERKAIKAPTDIMLLSTAVVAVVSQQYKHPKKNILGANKTIEYEKGQLTYSAISKFYYENQALDICENIAPRGEEFEAGVYNVNVFDGEMLIAQTSFTLKQKIS